MPDGGDTARFPHVAASALRGRAEVLAQPSPAPRVPGVYAWFFSRPPGPIDPAGCYEVDGWTLLYVGISPKEPPTNGRPPSRSTLLQRLRTHYAGNAAGSTLRRTLGCLLADEIGVSLRRVGSGDRYTLTNPGEQCLDDWMSRHARVCWIEAAEPWTIERRILASGLPLPLNVRDNPCLAHTQLVQSVRAAALREADLLPVLADSGGPRRGPRI